MTDVSPSQQQALTLSHQLARHVAATAFTSIPKSAVDAAKFFMLDTLAVANLVERKPVREGVRHRILPSASSSRLESLTRCHSFRKADSLYARASICVDSFR